MVGTTDVGVIDTVAGVPPTGGTVIMKTLRSERTSARVPSGEMTTSSGTVGVAGGGEPAGAGMPVTFTSVRLSVPSKRIDTRPSLPCHT